MAIIWFLLTKKEKIAEAKVDANVLSTQTDGISLTPKADANVLPTQTGGIAPTPKADAKVLPTQTGGIAPTPKADAKVLPTQTGGIAPTSKARAPAVPAFDCDYYVMSTGLSAIFFPGNKLNCYDAFSHWLQHGHKSHPKANLPPLGFYPEFDCLEYLNRYPELKPLFLMRDNIHHDCTNLKLWFEYIGKQRNHIGTYVP